VKTMAWVPREGDTKEAWALRNRNCLESTGPCGTRRLHVLSGEGSSVSFQNHATVYINHLLGHQATSQRDH
jgi:hypothetical protein